MLFLFWLHPWESEICFKNRTVVSLSLLEIKRCCKCILYIMFLFSFFIRSYMHHFWTHSDLLLLAIHPCTWAVGLQITVICILPVNEPIFPPSTNYLVSEWMSANSTYWASHVSDALKTCFFRPEYKENQKKMDKTGTKFFFFFLL